MATGVGAHAASAEAALAPDIASHLQHLQVERKLAPRTLALYHEALVRLQRFAEAQPVELRRAQVHHVRRWAAQLRASGLAPRSIALVLSAWRGFYRWLGRDGLVDLNPVDGQRLRQRNRRLRRARPLCRRAAVRLRPAGG